MARGKLLSCSILFAVLDFSEVARTVKSNYKLIKSNFYRYEKHLNYNFCVFKALRCSYVSLLVTV